MGNGPFNFSQILQNLRRTPGQQPTLQSQQPTPQDYADALEAYGRQPIRTPGALASNLAADAINRLGAGNAQNNGSIAGGTGPITIGQGPGAMVFDPSTGSLRPPPTDGTYISPVPSVSQ